MTPLFFIILFIGAFLLWGMISFLFPIIGGLCQRYWEDIKYNINKEEKKEEEKGQ